MYGSQQCEKTDVDAFVWIILGSKKIYDILYILILYMYIKFTDHFLKRIF